MLKSAGSGPANVCRALKLFEENGVSEERLGKVVSPQRLLRKAKIRCRVEQNPERSMRKMAREARSQRVERPKYC
ncbi:hypothetical protein KIN20_017249 [Parelaphostrongylus tenuis]|uniref:Uncharacterized protein n=1 Tax=Parelaphostrongylus tenuis TaxID=148309 RepID=A0AAD5ML93_PARTN|nr:hypothetical protein KIN20_017249 [Parelaphostrongylus tenuis]